MAIETLGTALQQIDRLFAEGSVTGLSDAQLLERFLAQGDAVAFEVLISRHGPMVLSVCRGVLRNPDDAEDAFQATFLVLVKKAGSIRGRGVLGGWLYRVAHHVATRANAAAARRRAHERQSAQMTIATSTPDPTVQDELRRALHQEIAGLSQKCRLAVVLCELEGLPQAQAASQLRWSERTLRRRLAEARHRLKDRLDRRGLAPDAGILGAVFLREARVAVPAAWRETTVRAAWATVENIVAPGTASVAALSLTKEVLKIMMLQKLKPISLGLVGSGVMAWATSAALISRGNELPRAAPTPVAVVQRAAPTRAPQPSARPIDQPTADQNAIEGTWEMRMPILQTVDGKPQPPLQLKVKWIIASGTITTSSDEDGMKHDFLPEQVFQFTLDPSKSPKTVELTEPGWGVFPGIYALKGDELKICYGINERPTEFVEDGQRGQFLFVLKRVSRTPERVTPVFARAPGCFWAVHPSSPGGVSSTLSGIVLHSEKEPDGSLVMTLAHPVAPGKEPRNTYRAVVFDAARNRHLPTPVGGGTGGNSERGPLVAMQRYRLDPKVLPAKNVTHVAVEMVTPDAAQEESRLRAGQAMRDAKAAGVEILPLPRVGETYDFSVTSIEGKAIRSGDLKGKVVVIDCWASWCSPCMEMMPKLKALYERHHAEGLEVLGICFDHDAKKAREALGRLGLTWSQVLVPNDEASRALWHDGADISSLPRILVLDRRGRLQADCSPQELEVEVAKGLKDFSQDR